MQDCTHIKPDGIRCGSPAMRDLKFCYFHRPGYQRRQIKRRVTVKVLQVKDVVEFELAPLNSRGIQQNIRSVIALAAAGRMSTRQARLMISGLQLAQCNLKNFPRDKRETY